MAQRSGDDAGIVIPLRSFAQAKERLAALVVGDGADPVAIVVPDHRDDGTPVLSLPVAAPFAFSYGRGSAARHIAEARRCGLDVRVLRDAGLGFDVDIEDDLRVLETLRDRS